MLDGTSDGADIEICAAYFFVNPITDSCLVLMAQSMRPEEAIDITSFP